jgi:hypothetical protein
MSNCGEMKTPTVNRVLRDTDEATSRKAWQTPELDTLSVLDTEVSGGSGGDFSGES